MRRALSTGLWYTGAWAAVVAGPVSAFVFATCSTPSICCVPRRSCLRESVDYEWGSFLGRLLVLLVVWGALWLTRAAGSSNGARNVAVLHAAALSACLSVLVTHALLTGMNAVIDGRTDVGPNLVASAVASVIVAFFFWRRLIAKTTSDVR